MKTNFPFAVLIAILISINLSCSSDPCNEGYTEVKLDGSTVCLPNYVVGIEKSNEIGNKFYHSKYGIIEFKNGQWKNQFGENIPDVIKIHY